MIPSVLMLSGPSAQTSSQLASFSPRPSNSGGGGGGNCTGGQVAGFAGGCCKQSQLEMCCPKGNPGGAFLLPWSQFAIEAVRAQPIDKFERLLWTASVSISEPPLTSSESRLA